MPEDREPGEVSDWRTPEETARLRDEAFARLMKMPPKPQKDMKIGKTRSRAGKAKAGPPEGDNACG